MKPTCAKLSTENGKYNRPDFIDRTFKGVRQYILFTKIVVSHTYGKYTETNHEANSMVCTISAC